ncbi:MAG TPA: LCP family protein, partial [Streptomyces sp.]|nr:LCP family protein [Streptomyces sp.]
MNEWSGGWNDGSRDRYGSPRTHAGVPPQGRGDYDAGYGRQPGYYDDPHGDYDSGYSNGQVYGGGRGGPGPGDYDPYYDDRPPRRRGRRLKFVLISLVVILLAWSVGTYFWADSKLQRDVDLSIVEDRPGTGEGTNYLVVGSDSREGLSAQEKQDLHTGSAAGKRTDSMMILHVGDRGPTLISLPRDSWVENPSFTGSESGKHFGARPPSKLNAAYAQDGAPLLVRTVEANTGLKIDHYAEIGFGGFAKIVDSVGGVEMNIPQDIKDKNSGADFRKGKQVLDGNQALSFVRNRHAGTGDSDLGRTKNQQKFLAALASQTATPATIFNPFKLYPTMGAGLDTLVVDKDMSLWSLSEMF